MILLWDKGDHVASQHNDMNLCSLPCNLS